MILLSLLFNTITSRPGVLLRKDVLKICNKFKATLLKSHFGMDIVLLICCVFSEQLFIRTTLDGCFYITIVHSNFTQVTGFYNYTIVLDKFIVKLAW